MLNKIRLGYPYAQKGYRIFDINSKKIYTSRDVIFYEKVFPYTDLSSSSSLNHVIPLPVADGKQFNFCPNIHDTSSPSSHISDEYALDHSPSTTITRLALQWILVKGFRLYSFQLPDSKSPVLLFIVTTSPCQD